MSDFSAKIQMTVIGGGGLLFGFLLGQLEFSSQQSLPVIRDIQPEISIVRLHRVSGDQLHGDISGPVRLLWAEENLIEQQGEFTLPLGQIPDENDLEYKKFPYTGNAKTGKFYPSDTYFARGVEVQHRRFFQTQQEAVDAGFIPSKSVQ